MATSTLALRGAACALGLVTLSAIAVAAFLPPVRAAEAADGVFYYTFNSPGTLREAPTAGQSSSPYFWLKSGGALVIKDGIGATISGALPGGALRTAYAKRLAVSSDDGTHPQNLFLLLTKASYTDASASVFVERTADNLAAPENRHAYNGESLVARYMDADTYYYAGIRADGDVVIKKKTGGVYRTLAEKPLFPGSYTAQSPDLIPLNRWIGLKLDVETIGSGVSLSLFTDVGNTGSWKLAASATDSENPITASGAIGIESDYADAAFDNFRIDAAVPESAPVTSSAPAAPAETQATASPAYDALVLSGKPALYLAMSSGAAGTEADLSGNGLAGAYKGGAPGAATLPNGDTAADFDGAKEYLAVPSSPSLSIPTTGQLTYEAWIRPDTFDFGTATGSGYVDWMGKCANYSPDCEWEARLYGNTTEENRPDRLSAYVFNPRAGLGSGADWQPSAPLASGAWLHVVAEYDLTATPPGCPAGTPGTIAIWVNGVKQSFADHAPTGCMSQFKVAPKAGGSPLTIGTMAFDSWFKGAVGKVAVYDRLLSQSEIDSHFEAMTGKAPSGSCGLVCTALKVI
jgi:hypothetical protein